MHEVVKKICFTGVLLVLGGILYYFRLDVDTIDESYAMDDRLESSQSDLNFSIVVHMAGAVLRPGVYKLPVGMTVMEAITYVGGVVEGANLDKVNLAKQLREGQRVFVPFLKRQKPSQDLAVAFPIAINRVNSDVLSLIPGVGVTIASEIVSYRNQHGRFKRYDDLLLVKYIGRRFLDKIKPYISLD